MKNNLFIISGPSGAGEDSVIEGLRKELPIEKVITTTTREIRSGESNGREYYFISHEEFQDKINNGEFFEWVKEDNNQLYGSTLDEINRIKNLKNKIGIWKIDYQGAINAKEILPKAKSILIYINSETIKKRLRARGNHSNDFIQSRLDYAKGWFDNQDKFDFKVENKEGKLSKTIRKVKEIIIENSDLTK